MRKPDYIRLKVYREVSLNRVASGTGRVEDVAPTEAAVDMTEIERPLTGIAKW
jgi:hypothetical protein